MKKIKRFNENHDMFNDEYKFTSEMDKSNVETDYKQMGIKDIDWVDVMSCKVFWDYELNDDNDGIYGIDPSIFAVSLTLDIFTYNEEKDMDDDKEYDFEFTQDNTDIEVISKNYDNEQKLPFYPRSVEIVKISQTEEEKSKLIINYYE